MLRSRSLAAVAVLSLLAVAGLAGQRSSPFVVAHRGASYDAPEHTLAAYRLALAQGADYIEQDLVSTRDGVLVCLHDPSLERTTNVEEVFPDRFTEVTVEGRTIRRWYPEQFTLDELRRLDAGSWFSPKFAGERIPTFQEAIDLIDRRAGIFPELKNPGRLRALGIDLERAVADALEKNDLVGATVRGRPAVQLQVFEEESLRRLATLLPAVPRTFLMGSAAMATRWLSDAGLGELKTFATGIGPSRLLIEADPAIVTRAHAHGLTVVPYTFRLGREGDTPEALTAAMRRFTEVYGVDGVFTDNPDLFPAAPRP